ncbi:autotransporter outer membrane beta-barrel domain-containing protein [Oceanicoccus sagamiensis]|uniref:Autotransporter domain-containing protein n=1 Tax=Oceanicoccus sagamiensis TaxID=716816 RepID=A0A1X9N550_9GAMM|nr:autotransporter outer membrane beta-barrel domain-containing protein [Oceanicoccus sagamiensis]ARN73240.1 hypothetical protein BST96_03425 [Oceanicoccus sagamiensis]
MQHSPFKPRLLSVSILLSALPLSLSADIIISTPDEPGQILDGVAAPNLTINSTGSINSSGNGVENSVVGTLTGAIFNNGSIIAAGDGVYLSGTSSIDGATTTLTAGVINNGLISASGSAFRLEDGARIEGGISNGTAGTIDGLGGGIVLLDSSISGGLVNSGVITSSVFTPGSGYVIDIQQSSIETVLNNASGSIVGGFLLQDSVMSGDFINDGSLTAASSGGGAFVMRGSSTLTEVQNFGIIRGDTAVVVEAGATLTTLTNRGLLDGSIAAVTVDGAGSSIDLIDNNIGSLISAGSAGSIRAINGGAIAAIENSGVIDGSIDFGAAGGSFTNFFDARVGDINNATQVRNIGGVVGDVVINADSQETLSNYGTMGNVTMNGGAFVSGGGTSGTVQGADLIALLADSSSSIIPEGIDGVVTTTINGDLNFSGTLTLLHVVSTAEAGVVQNPLLRVTGNADVTDTTVSIDLNGGGVFRTGDEFAFISSGGNLTTNDGSLAVQDDSLVVDFVIEQRGRQLYAVVAGSDFSSPVDSALENAGLDGTIGANNISNVSNALNELDDVDNDSELGQALGTLQGVESEEELTRAIASLDPDTVEGSKVGVLAADLAAASTIGNRMLALRDEYGMSGAVAGDPMAVYGFWVQAYDNDTDQDIRDAVDGFDAYTYGIAIGMDMPLSERTSMGVAFSYADTDVEGKVESNDMVIDSYRVALYGSYNADDYYFDSQFAYARNEYDIDRLIDPVLSSDGSELIANSSHEGHQFSVRLRGGYPIATEGNWFITPKVELDYTYLSEDDYREKDVGNLGLTVATQDVEVLIAGVGIKFAYPITTENEITWVPEFGVDYLYDFVGDEVEVDSNFIGVSAGGFITNGASAEKEMYKASFRMRAFGQERFSFSAGVDYIEKDDYTSQSLIATMRYDF